MAHASLLVRAAWICPVAQPPIRDGWVHIADEVVTAVGQGPGAPAAARVEDLGSVVVLPGLINAHTHLELSWLRGRVPPSADFLTWVGHLMRERTRVETADDVAAMTAASDAVAALRASGTVAVGDISNALITPALLAAAAVPGVVFHELMGFRDAVGRAAVAAATARHAALASANVRIVVAPHAPFSVSPELFRAIRDDVQSAPRPLTSVHVAESAAEGQLLKNGSGPWRERLEALGAWRADWTPPGCGPGDYLCDLGVIARGTLVVHGVQLTERELARIAELGATLVTCPRSNAWVGVGAPPVERFFASGVALAIGTDSLASAPDLNLFSELAELHRLAPGVPARRLVEAATQGGATALQLGERFGRIAPGMSGRLLTVRVPESTSDPELALVSGVAPEQIHWVGAGRVASVH